MNKLFLSSARRCLFAGLWFAFSALIPVGYSLLLFGDWLPKFGGSLLITALVPILLSGLMGLLLGSDILDRKETKSKLKAGGLGLSVAGLSFLFLVLIPAILTVFTSGDILGTIAAFVIFFLYGLFIVGWLAAIVGALAGLLLYLLREKSERKSVC
jgi:hypothetical protein